MIADIDFIKLSGSGNDFICIDNRDGRFDGLVSSGEVGHFARTLCHRGMGVGADGIVFAESTDILPEVNIFSRFFEPDGSEAELCGNGAACFIYWVTNNGWTGDGEVHVLTAAGVVRGQRTDTRYVRVCLPLPEDMATDLAVTVEGRNWNCDYLLVGVPHAVTYVPDVEDIEVSHWGRLLRHHERFAPRGANVNFVQVIGEGEIAVRTFEFGVEAETLACGTGSAAAAILAARRFNWPRKYLTEAEPVRIRARSGDVLKVWATLHDDGTFTDVCLETLVRGVCSGRLDPELAAEALGRSGG